MNKAIFINTKSVLSRVILLSVLILIFVSFGSILFAQEDLDGKIKAYRKALESTEDPGVLARTHYEIGLAMEGLGRDTEATAEYLKIMMNYPEAKEFVEKSEARLKVLYAGFSGREKEVIEKGEGPVEEEKEPTIFFTYVKSLYENYRDAAKYDKALYMLNKLVAMDPENQAYLLDLGNIYLYGYSDPDKALFYFNKVAELNPNHPSVYTDIGLAYEKKGDMDNAIKNYKKSVEISPVSRWSIYGLSRIEAIRLANKKELIKDFFFIGPFDNTDKKGMANDFPPEEKIDLAASYAGKRGVPVKWERPYGYDASGYVDLNKIFPATDFAVCYALTYVYSPGDREVQARAGSSDGLAVWVNDKEAWRQDVARDAELNDDIFKVSLSKGWNKILIKVAKTWGEWGFYFRVTDFAANPIGDLIPDPLKDKRRANDIYTRLSRMRMMEIVRTSSVYGVTGFIFLLGLYLMISNIHGKAKIRRMKEDFISSVSHELKTPLAGIRMFSETLRMGRVRTEDQRNEYYDIIIKETDRLTRFINKILDFSKLEKGKKIYTFDEVNVVDLAKRASEIFKKEVSDESLKLETEFGENVPEAEVDEEAILQVMLNLMENGYKYSKDEKHITLGVRNDNKNIFITVADRGVGIPQDKIKKIFEKFYRVDSPSYKGAKGSGLGLAFVKHIVDAHSGNISVQSKVGKGTKFTVSLPIKSSA